MSMNLCYHSNLASLKYFKGEVRKKKLKTLYTYSIRMSISEIMTGIFENSIG
jgi:hypothetical protein